LGNSFVEQLWEATLGSRRNFEEQLSGAALENNFGEPFSGTNLKLKHNNFG